MSVMNRAASNDVFLFKNEIADMSFTIFALLVQHQQPNCKVYHALKKVSFNKLYRTCAIFTNFQNLSVVYFDQRLGAAKIYNTCPWCRQVAKI